MNPALTAALEMFEAGNTHLRAADRRVLAPVLDALAVWLEANPSSSPRNQGRAAVMARLAAFLDGYVESQLDAVVALRRTHEQFLARVELPASNTARRGLLLDHLRVLGASRWQLRGDARALSRRLDVVAIGDRLNARVGEIEQRVALVLRRHGTICAAALAELDAASPDEAAARWRGLNLDSLAVRCFDHDGDPRVVEAAFACLAIAVRGLPAQHREALDATTLQFIYRAALDSQTNVWIQREALSLLSIASTESLVRTLQQRLAVPADGDDTFVRARAVEVWAAQVSANPALEALAEPLCRDPSDLVRQRLAEVLADVPAGLAAPLYVRLASADLAPQVRASALLAIARSTLQPALLELLGARLTAETDPFVFRVALEALQRLVARDPDADLLRTHVPALLAAVDTRRTGAADLRERRWSALARERLNALLERGQREVLAQLEAFIGDQLQRGRLRRGQPLPPELANLPDEVLGRAAAVLAQRDHGLDIGRNWRGRWRVWRGFTFGRHVWRILHELRRPATDKRQAFRHTTGRLYFGTVRAPSAIMAEVSPTKVPGEPRVHAEEDSWRPWLPLVDEVLAVVDQGFRVQPHQIYTSEGVTELTPPASAWQRLRAWLLISWRYAHFARLRAWDEGARGAPDAYVSALRALGFGIVLRAYGDPAAAAARAPDPSVSRFFAVAPLPWLADLWAEFRTVFFSPYQNTLDELILFAGTVAAWFAGRHVWLGLRMRRVRAALPLVIGGWGTRGKSGTERLKAALVNALGYSLCAKTTGCEAMLVIARPFRRPREISLFRPYDKATIWEQFNVAGMAARLRSDVMLWECMGLTPAYVEVLQQRWMRDDIATITNAFPDHEDIQGPAGINIPDVMCEFIPRGGTLLTTEESMLPVLRDDAQRKGTAVHTAGWLEAGLIPAEVMARFPYEEHPYNVALVLKLADQLGVERDLAMKEMADRVVMDLGVLKRYPRAELDGRQLEFIMGMSANERYGALGNWSRMGLDRLTPEEAPTVWLSTLVNNRADRVARSQVFAQMLVRDVSADMHVMVGSNLKGMRGYLDDAFEAWLDSTSLAAVDGGGAAEAWRQRAGWLRLPLARDELDARLAGVGCGPLPAGLVSSDLGAVDNWLAQQGLGDAGTLAWVRRWLSAHTRCELLSTELERATPERLPQLEVVARELLRDWFAAKIVWVDNPGVGGDELARIVAARTPAGLRNVLMGMQNIKGAGLSFVYAWQAFEQVHGACAQLEADREDVFVGGLDRLAEMQQFGVLAQPLLRAALEQARHSPFAQREARQAQLSAIANRLDGGDDLDPETDDAVDLDAAIDASRQHGGGAGLRTRLLGWLEKLADAGDAVDRRRRADRVYADLVTMRISETAAVAELQRISARQRGGWLAAGGQGWRSGRPASGSDGIT